MSVTDKTDATQSESGPRPSPVASATDPRITFFDHHAPTWDQNSDDVEQIVKRLEILHDRLALRAGHDVLELGCGTGRFSGWVAERVRPGRVVAADFSPEMLARAQARKAAAEYWLLDICAPPCAMNRFDVVFCFNAFPHFRDKPQALKSIHELLKPGGRLLILHLAGSARLNQFHARLAHPVHHDLLPSREEWAVLLSSTGWRLQSLADEPDLFLLDAVAEKGSL